MKQGLGYSPPTPASHCHAPGDQDARHAILSLSVCLCRGPRRRCNPCSGKDINDQYHSPSIQDRRAARGPLLLVSELFVSDAVRQRYYGQQDLPNPWGGAEAILTHTMTTYFPLPVTHGPLLGDLENAMLGTRGDPRDTSELISTTYIGSVLKGLHRSPRPLPRAGAPSCDPHLVSIEDLAALVLPAGAVGGVPFFMCLERGVPVILVEDNRSAFGLSPAELGMDAHPGIIRVKSYAEAAGVLLAMRAGIALDQISRPVAPVQAEFYG